jgi:hypothetical protein
VPLNFSNHLLDRGETVTPVEMAMPGWPLASSK